MKKLLYIFLAALLAACCAASALIEPSGQQPDTPSAPPLEEETLFTQTLEAAAPTTADVEEPPAPQPAPEEYKPDETEVEMLARMLWGEARGIPSDMEKAACVWCVLNRVDDESGVWPDTIAGVLEQKNQFAGYSAGYPATDELKALAADVLTRWQREKVEGGDVGRVLPAEYTFFTGDGKNNNFRTEYRGGIIWNWSLPNPYDN